jgi:AhpC/TSA family
MAISVDSPEGSENLRRSQGYTFPILWDAQEDLIRRWDLVHLHGRRDGADISRPAEFLIDPSGRVRSVNLTEDFVVRARPEEALAAFDAMNKSSQSRQQLPRLLFSNSRVRCACPVNSELVGVSPAIDRSLLTRLPGPVVVCRGRFWVRGLPFPNARHLGHRFEWKNTLPWHLGPGAKVSILRIKNLPPFRHYLDLQSHV